MALVGLIVLNEFARRSKVGGLIMFGVLPVAMTIYCIAIAVGVAQGQEWALTNPTHIYQNSWFHYAKVYAALAGCIGFMVIAPSGEALVARTGSAPSLAVSSHQHPHIAVCSRLRALTTSLHSGQSRVTSEGADAARGLKQRLQRHRRHHQHLCMTARRNV